VQRSITGRPFVGPVEPTDFFIQRSRSICLAAGTTGKSGPEGEIGFHGSRKLLGAEMLGYASISF
jgi:hypothetical protein